MGDVDRESAFSFEVPDGGYSLVVHRDGFEDAFIDDIEIADGVARLPPVTLKRAGRGTRATEYRPPHLISGPNPEYTQEAFRHQVEGLFVIKCHVPLSGTLSNCRVLKHLPTMDDSILNALQHRRYEPAIVEGVPAETDYVFKVLIRLPR
jgi:TonB family protein